MPMKLKSHQIEKAHHDIPTKTRDMPKKFTGNQIKNIQSANIIVGEDILKT